MQNTSKGRIITAIAPVSDGAPSQILSYNANPVTFRTIDGVLGRLREATDLLTMLKQERAERERLEAVISSIKRQIDGLPPKSERMVITQSTLFANL